MARPIQHRRVPTRPAGTADALARLISQQTLSMLNAGQQLVIAVALALSGCSTPSPSPASDYCVPRFSVTPAEVRPGATITVEVESGCDAPMPRDGWVVTAAPVGDLDAAVRHDGRGRPSSTDSPSRSSCRPTFPLGEAWAGFREWDYSGCPDGASCASPTGSFRVVHVP